jgi:crossover junction endodeoxyribonuclease RuvC
VADIIVGIDPGLKGGVAVLGDGPPRGFPIPHAGKEIDICTLRGLLPRMKGELVVIERVGAMPKQGVSSVFQFGKGFGCLLGIFGTLGARIELVRPQAWKTAILWGTDKSKGAAIEWVARQFPDRDHPAVISDGIADAFCLAEYGRRRFA